MNKFIVMLTLVMVMFNNCVVADIPEEITHNIQISGEDLDFIAGRCFDENLTKDEFLLCLEEDLINDGYALKATRQQ